MLAELFFETFLCMQEAIGRGGYIQELGGMFSIIPLYV